jgi:hypothetical protein
MHMDLDVVQAALLVALGVLQAFTLAQSRRAGGLTQRGRRRQEYALQAVKYAMRQGGPPNIQLEHALGAFKGLDEADNRRRDYTDKEARLAVDAAFTELKGK